MYNLKNQFMYKSILFLITMNLSFSLFAQEVINLPYEKATDVVWEGDEKEYHSEIWNTQVVTNVSVPTMQVYKPDPGKSNGASVIIAPGGGLYAQSIESEGIWVAEWLAKNGITAFVLKYRLVPSGDDAVAEMGELSQKDPAKFFNSVKKVIPYSYADGLSAISYVREHAEDFGVNPGKIGFMGFSAGGAVTMGVAYNYTNETRPNFLVPVYAWVDALPVQNPLSGSPPMLIICATDDPLDLAKGSIDLYNSWHKAGISVGLHMYSRGGHGFGMKKNGVASDTWIERCYEWMKDEKIID